MNNINNMNNMNYINNMNNMKLNNSMNNMNNNMNIMNNNNLNMKINNSYNNNGIVNFNNNFNNNISNNSNNQNNNIISQNNNSGNNNKSIQKDIFLTFTFQKYNKQIFLDINANDTFSNILEELTEKYNWLNSIKGKKYFLNEREIKENEFSKTAESLGIKDNSNIVIVVA